MERDARPKHDAGAIDSAQSPSASCDEAKSPASAPIPSDPIFPIGSEHTCRTGLPEALRVFELGGERGDGGREGMRLALISAISFIGSRIPRQDRQLIAPLMALSDALRDLDGGAVHPALMPNRRGRPKARWDVMQFKGTCIAASKALHQNREGERRWTRQQADRDIFERARGIAARLGISMTNRSVETWRRDARKSINKQGLPKNVFGFMALAMDDLRSDFKKAGASLEVQVDYLLDLVPISHLPKPVKTPEY